MKHRRQDVSKIHICFESTGFYGEGLAEFFPLDFQDGVFLKYRVMLVSPHDDEINWSFEKSLSLIKEE